MNSQRSDNPSCGTYCARAPPLSRETAGGNWCFKWQNLAQDFPAGSYAPVTLAYVCEKAVTNCAQEMHEQQIELRSLRVARASIGRKTYRAG